MVNVVTGILTNAPRPRVSGYAANPENVPVRYRNIASSRWRGEPLPAPGVRAAF
ncbi:hypothetical protein [Arthrobacter sp. SDTb3-6]|uniref:hypothetical protein n=1 Tax=Arthrobacter sp. SDTb3-6 TaxID=2713571 RepID=UPI001C3FF863|nr:hypothetical protein [Arthrobacter sp. SDTb3-6]